jgi:hypothetical protein
MGLILEAETYEILGACFEVYREKGCGFLEDVYQHENPRCAGCGATSNMEKPERDAPATDWSKMLQPLFRCQVPREECLVRRILTSVFSFLSVVATISPQNARLTPTT